MQISNFPIMGFCVKTGLWKESKLRMGVDIADIMPYIERARCHYTKIYDRK